MLLELKKYLMDVRSSSLENLVNHFNVSESFMLSLLDEWQKRGNVEIDDSGCANMCSGCCEKCQKKDHRMYRWISNIIILAVLLFSSIGNSYAEDVTVEEDEDKIFEFVLFADLTMSYDRIKNKDTQRHEVDKNFHLKEVDFGVNIKLTDFAKFYSLVEYDHEAHYLHGGHDLYFTDWHLELRDEDYPLYFKIGYYELPFGSTETNFIEDPITMLFTKTRDKAMALGYQTCDKDFDISYTLFESTVEKAHNNSNFNDWLINAQYTLSDKFSVGASYISNISSSLDLEDNLVNRKKLSNLPGGFSVYGNIQPHDNFNFLYKYVTATEHYEVGEIYSEEDTKRRIPSALDLEAQFPFWEEYIMSFRYAFSHDGVYVFPSWVFGPSFSWLINDYMKFSVEYLRSNFATGDMGTENRYAARVTLDL